MEILNGFQLKIETFKSNTNYNELKITRKDNELRERKTKRKFE